MNLGASDEAGVRERDRPVRVLLQERPDVGPVLLDVDCDVVDTARSERDDVDRSGGMSMPHQKTRFGHHRFARPEGWRALAEHSARPLVMDVVCGEQGHQRTGIQQDARRVHSPNPWRFRGRFQSRVASGPTASDARPLVACCGERQKSIVDTRCTQPTVQKGAHDFGVENSRRISSIVYVSSGTPG